MDKLPKDPGGKLFISLDKYDCAAEGLDTIFIHNQPKINVSQITN